MKSIEIHKNIFKNQKIFMQIDHNSHIEILPHLWYAKFMKTQTKLLTIFILLTILLSACGSNEVNRISGDVTNIASNSGPSAADTTEPGTDGEPSARPSAYKGYAFVHSGITIAIDADFAPILIALGEPRSYFESESCAFEGLDKIYTYNGFEIDTYPQKDDDFVSSIVLKDDTVSTAEGLSIGASRAEMEAAYGIPRENDNGQLVYEKDGMRLCFILDGEMVISIEYQTAVLDER
jgi:hypothetical protein